MFSSADESMSRAGIEKSMARTTRLFKCFRIGVTGVLAHWARDSSRLLFRGADIGDLLAPFVTGRDAKPRGGFDAANGVGLGLAGNPSTIEWQLCRPDDKPGKIKNISITCSDS